MGKRFLAAVLALALTGLGAGCASIASNAVADALSGTGTSFGRDDDPELVEDALPFALKTMEAVSDSTPRHVGLLTAMTAAFTEYAYGFLRADAERLEGRPDGKKQAEHLKGRAKKLLLRAYRYGLRGLEVRQKDFAQLFEKTPDVALAHLNKDDVPLLYWTAASLGASISIDVEDMDQVGELPKVGTLLTRAAALDESWDQGSIHELLMTYELSRPGGGDAAFQAARAHYERAKQLSHGTHLALYVGWAEGVSVKKQDRKEFETLLKQVIDYDLDQAPDHKLANLLAQDDARRLLAHEGDLFL